MRRWTKGGERMNDYSNDVKKAYILFNSPRRLIGVKFLREEEQYRSYSGIEPQKPLSYCVAVKSASLGHRLKMNLKNSGCGGSTRALGLEKPSEEFLSGESPFKLGLYKNREVARQAALQTQNLTEDIYGLIIQPIEFFEEEPPDVVLVIGQPRDLMRILQGYAYHYGIDKQISMSGNQGICVEATAYPLLHRKPNISLLCSGTRFLADWAQTEMVMGIPIQLFSQIVDGFLQTVNAVEPDDRKSEIERKFMEQGLECITMDYGRTYYTEYEREKREKRKADQARAQ